MAEDAVWRLLAGCLGAGVPAALVAVVDSAGSSPGRPGARLALAADGRCAGTVGGGAAEAEALEAARSLLREPNPRPRLLGHRHEGCGGRQTVALVPCAGRDLPAALALASGRPGLLGLSPAGLAFAPAETDPGRRFDPAGWAYEEGAGFDPLACLVGGGHVSLALSAVLALLDFRVAVLEAREGVPSFEANSHAHERRRVDYGALGAEIPEGERSYAVVMTHDHALDEAVLRQLVGRELRYLGMLGSRAKAAAVMARLGREFQPARLARVRAPAGLPIGSHSPAEIAVSIAAEMVAVRSGLRPW